MPGSRHALFYVHVFVTMETLEPPCLAVKQVPFFFLIL